LVAQDDSQIEIGAIRSSLARIPRGFATYFIYRKMGA
jgi:hypothetical protein